MAAFNSEFSSKPCFIKPHLPIPGSSYRTVQNPPQHTHCLHKYLITKGGKENQEEKLRKLNVPHSLFLIKKTKHPVVLSMVLNCVVDPNFGNLCGKCRQRRVSWIVVVVYPLFVSFPTGDNLTNLVITSYHLVKMTKAVILFYRPVSFPEAFLEE